MTLLAAVTYQPCFIALTGIIDQKHWNLQGLAKSGVDGKFVSGLIYLRSSCVLSIRVMKLSLFKCKFFQDFTGVMFKKKDYMFVLENVS